MTAQDRTGKLLHARQDANVARPRLFIEVPDAAHKIRAIGKIETGKAQRKRRPHEPIGMSP